MKTYRIDDDRSLWQLARDIVAQRRARKMLTDKEIQERAEAIKGQEKGIGTSPGESTPGSRPAGTLIPTGGGAPERMLRFFEYKHLPEKLQVASKPFCELAQWLCQTQPGSPERTKALNALCEAKDWAVRALVPEPAR